MPNITALTALLNKGQDSALLRFGLASAYLKEEPDDHLIQAEEHLKRCLALDPTYTAAYQPTESTKFGAIGLYAASDAF